MRLLPLLAVASAVVEPEDRLQISLDVPAAYLTDVYVDNTAAPALTELICEFGDDVRARGILRHTGGR